MIQKLFKLIQDRHLATLIAELLSNGRFYVQMDPRKSKWKKPKMVFLKERCWRLYFSTFVLMTSLRQKIPEVSLTLTTVPLSLKVKLNLKWMKTDEVTVGAQ